MHLLTLTHVGPRRRAHGKEGGRPAEHTWLVGGRAFALSGAGAFESFHFLSTRPVHCFTLYHGCSIIQAIFLEAILTEDGVATASALAYRASTLAYISRSRHAVGRPLPCVLRVWLSVWRLVLATAPPHRAGHSKEGSWQLDSPPGGPDAREGSGEDRREGWAREGAARGPRRGHGRLETHYSFRSQRVRRSSRRMLGPLEGASAANFAAGPPRGRAAAHEVRRGDCRPVDGEEVVERRCPSRERVRASTGPPASPVLEGKRLSGGCEGRSTRRRQHRTNEREQLFVRVRRGALVRGSGSALSASRGALASASVRPAFRDS